MEGGIFEDEKRSLKTETNGMRILATFLFELLEM
jgi:hypothetical protein